MLRLWLSICIKLLTPYKRIIVFYSLSQNLWITYVIYENRIRQIRFHAISYTKLIYFYYQLDGMAISIILYILQISRDVLLYFICCLQSTKWPPTPQLLLLLITFTYLSVQEYWLSTVPWLMDDNRLLSDHFSLLQWKGNRWCLCLQQKKICKVS